MPRFPRRSFPTFALLAIFLALPGALTAQEGPPAGNEHAAEEKTGGWRLADSTSLYLREHAENPVEWYPWGDEAFARAKKLDRPVFLSIGYASCHWCHVMRRESFSDPTIAKFLADHFISIKVDREDLPHVDAVYMDAVRAMSGRGGWPLTVFLTPDRTPFFGGTYFPPTGGPGRPGFTELTAHIDRVWNTERAQVVQAGTALLAHLANRAERSFDEIGTEPYLALGLSQARERFDSRSGGWRDAPKFPDPRLIDFLIASTRLGGPESDEAMAFLTLEKMIAGGVYDQVGGGFHRYSVDAFWSVPHFEKMLYSQGQLGESYAEAARLTGRSDFADGARDILDALLEDFQLTNGAFAASWDADSGGEEGTFYVWTPEQIDALFETTAAAVVKSAFGITSEGNFEGGGTVLFRAKTIEELAAEFRLAPTQIARTLTEARKTLRTERAKRVAPKRDDKVILGWNATAISALAKGATALRNDRYRREADRALAFLREHLVTETGFRRRHAGGETAGPGTLVDAALYLKAVIDLYEASFDAALIAHAREVATWIERDFADNTLDESGSPRGGAYFETPTGVTTILARRKQHFGSALPTGNGTHARNLLRLHGFTGESTYLTRADAILTASLAATAQAPVSAPELLIAAAMRHHGFPEIVIAGDLRNPRTRSLLDPALRSPLPFRVIAHCPPGEAAPQLAASIPILAGRAPIEGRPTAWFCENGICLAPTQKGTTLQGTITEWLAARKPLGPVPKEEPVKPAAGEKSGE